MNAATRYDIVVVGAGNAALTAALSASQNGARVIVLEKAPQVERGGNSRFSGGMFRFSYEGIEDIKPLLTGPEIKQIDGADVGRYDPSIYYDDVMRVTQREASTELSRTLTKESLSTMLWMSELGVEWEWTYLWATKTEEGTRFSPGSILQARGKGVGLMEFLYTAVQAAGIDIAYQTKATSILQDATGRVIGVGVRTPSGADEILCGSVILASGGFEANAEMRARYLGTGWDRVRVRGSRFNTGETLRMALDIGANPVGHWQGCHATPIAGDAPKVGDLKLTDMTNRLSYPYSIMVNTEARRFVDEGEDTGGYTYAKTGRAILAQPGNLAYQIFDTKTIHLLEKRYSTTKAVTGNTINEIAKKLSLPATVLERTITEFNLAVQPGDFKPGVKDGKRTTELQPPKSNWALPIDSPPFSVYPVACGITFTFGGIQIDSRARVIDTEGNSIPGLYATGEIAGDFFYHNYPGGTGLMRGAVFGRISGANAAAETQGKRV